MNDTTVHSGQAGRPFGRGERLRHFPVPFFAVVMGLAGLALAWQRAAAVMRLPFDASGGLAVLAAAAFVAILAGYGLKLARYPGEVLKDLHHPVRVNFFATITIGLVLLATLASAPFPGAAIALWTVAAVLHLGFTLYVVNAWIHRTGIEVAHVNPAWFIPVVGNVLLPIAGVQHYGAEVSWFFFSVGVVFWLVLLTIVFYRLFFHAPLPERLTPTLFILVAPPAVSCIAYVSLTNTVDSFARVLYYTALFLGLVLASDALRYLRTRFFLSAWAYSFPLAALTLASLLMSHRVGGPVFTAIAAVLLGITTLVVIGLAARTVVAIARHEICVEER